MINAKFTFCVRREVRLETHRTHCRFHTGSKYFTVVSASGLLLAYFSFLNFNISARTKSVWECIFEKPRNVWVLQSRSHVRNDFLVGTITVFQIRSKSNWINGIIPGVMSELTSTAELLNVRHAGAGRMNGRPRGPVDLLPCGAYHRKNPNYAS